MPWGEVSIVDLRQEFVMLASLEGANVSELCARFGISRQTGYKWLGRSRSGLEDFTDRSRRPLRSPNRTPAGVESAVLAVRDVYPAWGARKIAWCLERDGIAPPAVSTVHTILQRHDRIPECRQTSHSYGRFEKPAPNLLWQMDFKGRVQRAGGKSRAEEGYYVIKGTLTQYNSDATKRVTAKAREVTLRSFPEEPEPGPK